MPDARVIEDARLVRRAKNGDIEAFAALHDSYAKAIYRFLFARLNHQMDAEDLTGEVFLRAWNSLSSYRQRGFPFSAYLFRIARNLLADHYRRLDRERLFVDQDARALSKRGSLDDQIMSKQEHQELYEILSKIKDDYRDVLILRFISGLTPDEIAIVMRRSPGAVRVLQHRALAALRKQFDEKSE